MSKNVVVPSTAKQLLTCAWDCLEYFLRIAPKKEPIRTAVGRTTELMSVSLGEIMYSDTQQPTICVNAFRPCEIHDLKDDLNSWMSLVRLFIQGI